MNIARIIQKHQECFRDKPFLGPDGDTADFAADNNNNTFFKFKPKIIGKTVAPNGRKNVEIMVSLKCSSNSLINCEINLILILSDKCVLSNDTKAATFSITDAKLYVPIVTLSTQDNAKLP